MVKWFDLWSGIVNRTSIDQLELQAFLKERDFWRNVVKRMVDVIIFLSERNLAFRGSNEKLGDPSNGNFLGLKLIQSPDVSIDVLQAEVGATMKFLEDYRNTGYNSVVTNAREIAEHMDIEQVFPETRVRRKKRMFDYECADDSSRLSAKEKFKSQFFLVLTDQAISSVSSRFDQLVEWYTLFGFLYNANSLKQCHRENELENHSKNFERKMGDIDANELIMELNHFIYVIEKERGLVTANNFLTYIYKNSLQEIYPNLYICIRILLTTPDLWTMTH
ncbi:hypothetical protein KIL84_013567 [Mauremys mutica]|uniref:Uncharacterized protein n=1 Tax=Mauremys mutica TaxID=74926 RepID=A0A9D3WXN3_9SAUR|nr:hypothetical protein KIL84_013567 [Mauremys mutica]